ncbi:MAG: hypothetical protein WBK77_10710 [Alphaproteobacteria bacterium]
MSQDNQNEERETISSSRFKDMAMVKEPEVDLKGLAKRVQKIKKKRKVKDFLFNASILLGPLFFMIYLCDEIDAAFNKSGSSSFISIVVQSLVGFFSVSLIFLNAIYIDKRKEGISYEKMIRENITMTFYVALLAVGFGILQWVAI